MSLKRSFLPTQAPAVRMNNSQTRTACQVWCQLELLLLSSSSVEADFHDMLTSPAKKVYSRMDLDGLHLGVQFLQSAHVPSPCHKLHGITLLASCHSNHYMECTSKTPHMHPVAMSEEWARWRSETGKDSPHTLPH